MTLRGTMSAFRSYALSAATRGADDRPPRPDFRCGMATDSSIGVGARPLRLRQPEGPLAHARAELAGKQAAALSKQQAESRRSDQLRGLDFHVAQAQVEEAAAEVQAAAARVDNCVVEAPFPGRVAGVPAPVPVRRSRPAAAGYTGRPELDLELIVPSRWLSWLQPGTPFTVSVGKPAAATTR